MSEPDPTLALSALSAHESSRTGAARYERLEKLGSGGMAIVYRALDHKLGREVALKEVRPDLALEHEVRARFKREAEAIARLSHRHVVALLDTLEEEGRLVLVMELVKGEPLSQILASRRGDAPTLARIVAKAARGVHHAHEQGIVHRDLKPSNVLLDTASGEPKVADFGLAHLGAEGTKLTQTGALLGTPLYMAPEQVEGRAIGPPTDVYALGVILYEVLAGRVPFEGDTLPQITARIVRDEPVPPRRIRRGVPRDLETIALACLEKDPARRYASAAALADDLERALAGEAIVARPPGALARAVRWASRRRALAASLAVLVACGGVAGGVAGGVLLRQRARIASLLEAARSEPDPARAADLYAEVAALAPGNPEAPARAIEKRLEAERVAKAKTTAELVLAGRRALEAEARARQEIVSVRAAIAALSSGIVPYAGAAEKRPLWDLELRIETLTHDADVARADAEASFLGALSVDATAKAAREAFAALHYEAYEDAERRGDHARMEVERRLVLLHGSADDVAKLGAPGVLSLDTTPSGASVWLLRYETGPDRRLVPRPAKPAREMGVAALASSVPVAEDLPLDASCCLGQTPLRSVAVPPGSYLLVFTLEGYRPVRYPILVTRGLERSATVRIFTDAEIGKGFVYVPGGEFIFGGETRTARANDLEAHARTKDLFIGRYEVTMEEYTAFLDSIAAEDGPEDAQDHVPRQQRSLKGARYLWNYPRDGQRGFVPPQYAGLPVYGISWEDARAYVRWRTEEARARGEKRKYRLPTEREWEKAARGADGRVFPWGDHFDWTFCLGGQSSKDSVAGKHVTPRPPGTYPHDESPYGIRDLAGNVSEWVGEPPTPLACVKGGSFVLADGSAFVAAQNAFYDPRIADMEVGFRVACEPP